MLFIWLVPNRGQSQTIFDLAVQLDSLYDNREWVPNFGFAAPIGIGVNWGYRSKIKKCQYHKANYRNRVQKTEVEEGSKYFD